jgi:Mg-chelatase subunit ChlD
MEASASRVHLYEEDFVAVQLRGVEGTTTQRQPIHLLFIIDISDSMSDSSETQGRVSKLEHVKQSMTFLLPLLLPSDSLSLISFGDDATVHIDNQLATAEGKSIVEHTISQLKTDGCTNMSAGLLAMREVARATAHGQKPGALLLTDGMANLGVCQGTALCTMAEELLASVQGLTLTTVGYGIHHDTHLLQELASLGSGSYNVVSSKEHVASTLGDVFGGLTSVVAQMVSVTLPEGLEPMTKYTWKPTQRKVQIGDLYAENEVILLAKQQQNTGTIQINGVAMPSLTPIQLYLLPNDTPSTADVPKGIVLAYFRYHVSQLLEHCAEHRGVLEKVTDLQTKLRALSYTEDLLVQMMLDDLEHLLEDCRNPYTGVSAARNTSYMQHAAYLSLGRGLRSDIDDSGFGTTAHFASQDPEESVPLFTTTPVARTRSNALNAVASPFSNRSQLQATASMRTASQSQRDS